MQSAEYRQSSSASGIASQQPAEQSSGQSWEQAFEKNATHISMQAIAQMTAEDVDTLAQRLEQDAYANAFEGLEDWHLLRAIAFQRAELVEPYLHLLDLEAFDES
jgi:hypothetical protein